MPKKNKTPKRKSPDALLKTSKKRDIELTEQELGKVSGGGRLFAGRLIAGALQTKMKLPTGG
jgi:hypothetical protein